jgi:type IV pilus assembly protein PilY1
MKLYRYIRKHVLKALIAATTGLFSVGVIHSASAGLPDQRPLFLVAPVKPILMLAMPKEQQLFYKLYNDYTDLSSVTAPTPDGKLDIADTTYNPVYEYYGYFDSKKCYTYVSGNLRFEPSTTPSDDLPNCPGTADWSGNFLNWATMTRMDAIRKILYGGYRFVDNASTASTPGITVLERAFLPNDAHSFAKFFAPIDSSGAVSVAEMKKVIPDALADVTGATFCNTTDTVNRSNNSSSRSQNVTEPPLMKAAKGNYSLWAANERWQCGWSNDANGNSDLKNASNSNNPGVSLINANTSNPARDDTTGYGNYVVRVQVCKQNFINIANDKDNEKCYTYEDTATKISTVKPRGLLQTYGENDSILFGLVTGSYNKNKDGGVLRKAASSFKDEVNASTGVFLLPTNSIVKTLDKLRIYGYRYDDGTYFEEAGDPAALVTTSGADNCKWGINTYVNGTCKNWGNPQAEIYLETLRYLAGKAAPSSEFSADDTGIIAGLTSITTSATKGVDWADPITNSQTGNYCTPLNIMQFNASITSYDANELTASSSTIRTDMSAPTLAEAIDNIANVEKISGDYFIGKTSTATDGLCTAKNIDGTTNKLSSALGICPEAPRLEGSYAIAGLAYLARKYGVGTETTYKREKIKTLGVALASALPKVEVTVPGSSKKITIIPACRNDSINGNCAIVDFKVAPEVTANGVTSGQLYVVWEDSEQGGDFDQDMWGIIKYSVSSSTVSVTTRAVAKSTGYRMGFGYVIGGVTLGGFKVDSGVNDFVGDLCIDCNVGDTPIARLFTVAGAVSSSNSSSSASSDLQLPLYYAAKWGGWSNKKDTSTNSYVALTDAEIYDPNKTNKSAYYYATEPKALEAGLNSAFADTANIIGSASTVAANSTSIQGDTRVYQARFDSSGWTGQLISYPLNTDGTLGAANWSTDTTLVRPAVNSASTAANAIPSSRKIFTANNTTPKGTAVLLSSIDDAGVTDLKVALKATTESDYTNAGKRFNWIMGSAFYENTIGGLRIRTKLMGDVINSDPGYAGGTSFRYELLPNDIGFGAASYQSYITDKLARTAAVFVGANDGMLHAFNAANGNELFAYIPRGVYAKFIGLTSPSYTHAYSVDGPIYVSDVFISPTGSSGTKSWRTIVTGTLGNGGLGAYALDVTDVLAGTATAPRVIFDVSGTEPSTATAPNSTLKDDLGYSQSKILVLPAQGGKWIAVWGNGTNSVNGYSRLLAVDVETPTSAVAIDTKAKFSSTTDNGLAGVAFLPSGTGLLASAYGGDLLGNMWKFDLTNADINNWGVAYGTSSNPAPLIKVIDPSGVAQPITATPTLGRNSLRLAGNGSSASPSTMVYFGTGKYGEATDNSNTQVQSMYGIADSGNNIALTTSNRATKLHQKTISAQTTTNRTLSGDANTASGPAVTWTGSNAKDGWFLDLIYSNNATGERVLSKPLLLFDRVIINTFIASANPCDFGGSGWLMELVGVGDVYKTHSVLGAQANHVLERPIIGDLLSISAGEKGVILGSELGDLTKDGGIVVKGMTSAAGSAGRMSWRQIK